MKPLYVIGTQRNVGKTTVSLGLLDGFRKRGLKVAYMKPIGQRFKQDERNVLHDDARVIATFLGDTHNASVAMALPLPPGRVEREIHEPKTKELLDKIMQDCRSLSANHDLVILEAMGHVAMGSCLRLSAADVARNIGARTLLISEGGIGRAIDEISLCGTFVDARGADLMGVVLNKVWPEKYDRVTKATTLALTNMGINTYGAVPFQEKLGSPTMQHVYNCLEGEVLGGSEHFEHRVGHIIIAAMEPVHMIKYVKSNTLIITPGDRDDTIFVSLSVHMLGGCDDWMAVSGLILTGGFRPSDKIMTIIKECHLPTILVQEDTYTAANTLHTTVFKLMPDDKERIDWTASLVGDNVDVDGIAKALA